MNGNSLFVDTNILLYLLSGDATIAELLDEKHIYVSFITELEILGYASLSAVELKVIQEMLNLHATKKMIHHSRGDTSKI